MLLLLLITITFQFTWDLICFFIFFRCVHYRVKTRCPDCIAVDQEKDSRKLPRGQGWNAKRLREEGLAMGVDAMPAGADGMAGVMQVGRLQAASPTIGAGLELTVVAGVLLGGTRLSGGVGSITGTVIGLLFLQTVSNSLTIQGVSSYWQQVVTGVLLGAAVLFDRIRIEYSGRSKRGEESNVTKE